VSCALNCCEYIAYSSWYYSLEFEILLNAFHGKRFSCSRLAICKYCSVITFQDTLDDGHCSILKDWLLLTVWRKYRIKSEISVCRNIAFFGIRIIYSDSTPLLINIDDEFVILRSFLFVWGSAPHNDLNRLSFRT
jgi:hypothetical protein